jgi:hypothetical protein
MRVLFNGEYLDKDMSYVGGFEKIKQNQMEQYQKYTDIIVGDFKILRVEYDWGKRSKRAYVECTKCGEKSYFYNVGDWLRGKGRSTTCHCTKEALRIEANERRRLEQQRLREERQAADELAKERKAQERELRKKENQDKYPHIQKGFELEKKLYELFLKSGYTVMKTPDVGDYGVDIILTKDNHKMAIQVKYSRHKVGIDAVQEVYAGGRFYDCDQFAVVGWSGYSDSAIHLAAKLGVYLAQDVFEYPSNMSEYAVELLPTQNVEVISRGYTISLAPPKREIAKYDVMGQNGTISELCRYFGVGYNKVQYRMREKSQSVEQAIKGILSVEKEPEYSYNGYVGSMKEVCEHFGVRQQTILYRMKHMKMSFEEAMDTPNRNTGKSLVSEVGK